MTPEARARLRLEAFIGELLDRVPLLTLGQLVETVARDDDARLASRLAFHTWHHEGVMAFVRELAERLGPELVDAEGPVDERAAAALTVMDWSTVPVEVASDLARRLAYLCRVTAGPCFCGYHRSEVCE